MLHYKTSNRLIAGICSTISHIYSSVLQYSTYYSIFTI